MHYDENALKIWVDGSAYKNPGGVSGLGGFLQYPDSFNKNPEVIFKESYKSSTNNRMELKACVLALRYIRQNYTEWKSKGINRFLVITDSQYVYTNQKRPSFWRKNGWRNLEGKPIENIDLWKSLLSLSSVNAEIVWHQGKTNEINRLVDKLAKEATQSLIKKKDLGFRPGKISSSKGIKGSSLAFPSKGQSETIRIYKYETEGVGINKQQKIYFSLYSLETKSLLPAKYHAYSKVRIDISRNKYYSVIFGGNERYPLIESISETDTDIS